MVPRRSNGQVSAVGEASRAALAAWGCFLAAGGCRVHPHRGGGAARPAGTPRGGDGGCAQALPPARRDGIFGPCEPRPWRLRGTAAHSRCPRTCVQLFGKVDLQKAAIGGHSFGAQQGMCAPAVTPRPTGAATALETCVRHPELFRACVHLDGWQLPLPETTVASGLPKTPVSVCVSTHR
jgi:hypothetical protein